MSGRKTRVTNHPYAVEVNNEQIPDWVREVPNPPREDLAGTFTRLRGDLTPFFDINDMNPDRLAREQPSTDIWISCLDKLAARAEENDRERHASAPHAVSTLLELLDLVPGYLLCLNRYPWIRKRLYDLFNVRAYSAVTAFNSTLGKLPSDNDLRRLALYNLVRPHCKTDSQARETIASFPGEDVSPEAVRKSVTRAGNPTKQIRSGVKYVPKRVTSAPKDDDKSTS